uniref:Uncharacterized protein n=1 Tax=Anopheles christyi TaxID=43041 RepID=A0A182K159_9DIPT
MAKNPTKAELKTEIRNILKDANLEETAAKKVRLQLEKNLKCDLSNRKKEVDELVMDYVNSQASSEGEEDDEDDDDCADNGKGKNKVSKAKGNSDYEDEEEDEDDDDDEDFSEDDKPKGRKSGGKRGTPAKRGPAKKKKRTSNSEDDSGDDDKGSDDDYNPKGGAKGSKPGSKKKNDSDSDSDGDWKQAKPAAKGKKAGGAKKSNGYTRPYTLSADLAELCGAESLPRHEVVKKIWAIIKERNLYDPKNRQFAICDEQLRKVIGVKRFRTFGMLKYLKPHFKD